MKPQIDLARTETPDGGQMVLYQHDDELSIQINGQTLMSSKQHESELALARLGCAHLAGQDAPHVLIGGLGMGYTLRQTLNMLGERAKVTVSELLPAVVDWNREHFAALNEQPIDDSRTKIVLGDILKLLSHTDQEFDAILIDIDNGPSAITDAGNSQIYTRTGIELCKQALRNGGTLAIWSAEPSKPFEHLLMSCGFHVRRYKVPAYSGTTKNSRFIWVAAESPKILPPGGGEPRPAKKKKQKGNRYTYKKR